MLNRSRSWPSAAFVCWAYRPAPPPATVAAAPELAEINQELRAIRVAQAAATMPGPPAPAAAPRGRRARAGGIGGSATGAAGTSGGAGTGAAGTTGVAGTSGGAGAAGRGGAAGGAAGRGGAAGGAAGRGGAAGGAAGTGVAGTGVAGVTGTGGAPTLIWPNDTSKANSDTWLSQNHNQISQLRPKVLVIDLENTANAPALVDRHIAALSEATSFHKYKDASAQPAVVYQLAKIVQATKSGSAINYTSWNTQAFADSNIQIKDPADPSGPNQTLCQLFEKGIIHEVWCMASRDPKCGETQEAKQRYDANGNKMAGELRVGVERRQHHHPRLQGHRAHHRLQLGARHRLPPARDGARVGALHGRQRGAVAAQGGGALPELGSHDAPRAHRSRTSTARATATARS